MLLSNVLSECEDLRLFPYSFLLQEYLKPLFLIDCDGEGKDIGFD